MSTNWTKNPGDAYVQNGEANAQNDWNYFGHFQSIDPTEGIIIEVDTKISSTTNQLGVLLRSAPTVYTDVYGVFGMCFGVSSSYNCGTMNTKHFLANSLTNTLEKVITPISINPFTVGTFSRLKIEMTPLYICQ